MARNALHGLFLPACILTYAYTLAVTNPDTVKRICSTLCRAAYRPARNVAGAFRFRFRPRCAGACLRLVFVPLACAYSYRGLRRTFHNVFNKNILNKKIAALLRPYTGYLQFERACFIRPQRYGLILHPFELCANSLLRYAQLIGYRCNAQPLHTIIKYKRGTFTE